jgi:membrane-bound inhibitor of C-type lysozyme
MMACLHRPRGDRVIRFAVATGRVFVLAALLSGAACVSDKSASDAATTAETASAVQPSHATYVCGDQGTLDVDNMRTSVRLTDPDGDNIELPASPADQTSRYTQTTYALVLEGKEALYMKAGKEPMTCLR